MRKFLIGNSFGGAQITKPAWDYLVSTITDDVRTDMYHVIWQNAAVANPNMHEDQTADNTESIRFPAYLKELSEFRQIILNLIERLHYDYARFDELNDQHTLRIVEIPDDGRSYTIYEDEYGSEYVTQIHKNYFVQPDWLMRAKYNIKSMCKDLGPSVRGVFNNTDTKVSIALDGAYGMAKCFNEDGDTPVFFFLKRNEYYAASDEHQKEGYDIIFEDSTANCLGFIPEYFDATVMKSLVNLYSLLQGDE